MTKKRKLRQKRNRHIHAISAPPILPILPDEPATTTRPPHDPLFTPSQLTLVTGGWTIAEFILIRETRVCLCGSSHIATASHPRILLVNKHGDTRTCNMRDVQGLLVMLTSKLREEFKWPTLPRSILDVEIKVSSCLSCFTPLSPAEDDLPSSGDRAHLQYPLSLSAVRRLLTFAEEMQPTVEELRAARDGRISPSKPCSPAIVPLDLSLL